jgi:hypothetical protein
VRHKSWEIGKPHERLASNNITNKVFSSLKFDKEIRTQRNNYILNFGGHKCCLVVIEGNVVRGLFPEISVALEPG